jgi:hypothetical protein
MESGTECGIWVRGQDHCKDEITFFTFSQGFSSLTLVYQRAFLPS